MGVKTLKDLVALYARVMAESTEPGLVAANDNDTFTLRLWDGMDGCWCDCLAGVSKEEALRAWAERTKEGTEKISFFEIDYYRIFRADTRMVWDGSDGRELFR